MFYSNDNGVITTDIQESLLLACKRGIRHIFRSSRRTYSKRHILCCIRVQLVIGFTNSLLQLWLKRRVDNPLTDLRTGFSQGCDIFHIQAIQ